MTNRPTGLTLLLTGIVLFFVIRPIVDGIWIIGGLLGAISFGVGLLAMLGGGFLFFRGIRR